MPKYDPSDHDWRLNAACKDTDPSLFFPIGTTGLAIDQIEAAKQVCTKCPCMEDSLQFAFDTNQDAGVWGGLGEEERRVIRRQRAAARRAARLAAAEAQAGL